MLGSASAVQEYDRHRLRRNLIFCTRSTKKRIERVTVVAVLIEKSLSLPNYEFFQIFRLAYEPNYSWLDTQCVMKATC